MSDSTVEVEFTPPKQLRESENAFILKADGEDDLILPKKLTELRYVDTPDGPRVNGAVVPDYIAAARGLAGEPTQTEDLEPAISRHDWFMGCAFLGLLIRGSELPDAIWNAQKAADKITETRM